MKFSPDNSLKHLLRLAGDEDGEFVDGLNRGAASECREADVFGHSYGRIFEVLEDEIRRALPAAAPLKRKFDSLCRRWMNADDNPRFAKDPSLYFAFNQKLNEELRHLFQKLGYDGFVYTNELEDGESAADSYCVFDDRQVAVVGVEVVAVRQEAA